MKNILVLLVASVAFGACASTPIVKPSVSKDNRGLVDVTGDVQDPRLKDLLRRHWDHEMQVNPVWATTLGDHRFDDRIDDWSETAVGERRAATRRYLQEARNLIAGNMSEDDRLTLALFIGDLERRIDEEQCETHRWSVSTRNNPVSNANVLSNDHAIEDLHSAQTLLLRYEKLSAYVDTNIANLRRGLDHGLVANAESLRRTIELVDGQLGQPLTEWELLEPVALLRTIVSISSAQRKELETRFRAVIEGQIVPAFERYRNFLQHELLPKGRDGKDIGTHALPKGQACYAAKIRRHIHLAKTAAELHDLGKKELIAINAQMTDLGAKLFWRQDAVRDH